MSFTCLDIRLTICTALLWRNYNYTSKSGHPNIIQLLGAGTHSNDTPFLVLERLDGGSLTYLLNKPRNNFSRDHPFSVVTALEILRSLANAVKYLHWEFHKDAVLIHRDIKPDNIWYVCFFCAILRGRFILSSLAAFQLQAP